MTAPAWQPNHAYQVTARVTKVVPDGTAWWVVTAGTSGNVEPTWPTVEPWQVVDGGVTWGLASSEVQQQVAGLYASLLTFQAANPTLINQVSASRPKSLTNGSMPFVYVNTRDESMSVDARVRTRIFTGLSVVFCDVAPDNLEVETRMDFLHDGLVDLFTKYVHAASPRALTGPVAVNDYVPAEEGLYCRIITMGDSSSVRGTDT